MGFFSSAIKAVANPLSITNPSSIGNIYNDVTGATSAAKLAQSYNLKNMAVTNQYQKEFAQNAHQWEAQDLMKAGYNPALTTGLGGASAGGAGGGAGAGSVTNGSPIDAISTIGNLINSTSATKADVKLKEAQALAEPINAKANMINAVTNQKVGNANIGATERGGLQQYFLGNKSPIKAIEEKIYQKAEEAQNAKKKYTKKEKEIANKFDNLWK